MVTTKSKVKSKSQSNTKTPSRTKAKPKAAPDNQVNKHADKQAGILGGSGDHRMIALNKLNISPKNVRRIKASEADDAELLASIRQQGIKQNLVVHPGPKGMFLVDAGGRRLKALQTLAEEGAIPEDHGVASVVAARDARRFCSGEHVIKCGLLSGLLLRHFRRAAGRYGDLRMRSKSVLRALTLSAPHWFSSSRSD